MKKYIILFVVALFTGGMSANIIYLWRTGIKTEITTQTNDSITFDNASTPTMRIWRNGEQIYEWSLQEDDSVTYAADASAICFDYDHWRELDTINIYEFNDHIWQAIALPWAAETSTTIPDYYRFPNLEFHIDTTNHDTVPTWQLAFNTCHNPLLDGVHMFGLWNEKSNIMRIYSYLETLPNPNAAYCFYRVTLSSPAYIDRDAMTWMPSDSIIRKGNWNSDALSGEAAAPSTTIFDLMPFAALKDDGSEAFKPVQAGWLCFDLPLSTGIFNVSENGSIDFSLESVQSINATGTVNFNMALKGTGEGTGTGTGTSTSTGGITIPGNKNKKTAGWLNAIGSFIGGIGSAITSGTSASSQCMELGIAGGIAQGVGSIFSLAGNGMNANEEAKDKRYGMDFSTKDTMNMDYDFNFNFNGTITGEFKAQLTSTLSSSAKPLSISYNKFFEGILAHPKPHQAPKAQKNNGSSQLSYGIWNLKKQPEYYVRELYTHIDGKSTIISFFDPSSIELEINTESPLFDANEIDSIKLFAYDFVFVDSAYNLPAQQYYDFYGIHQDVVGIIGEDGQYSYNYTDFLLDQSATYKTVTKGDYSYTGVVSDSLSAYGFGMYNMVYSPVIQKQFGVGDSLKLSEISIAVVVEMTFKNGEKRIFAERYLPEIIQYDMVGPLVRVYEMETPGSINGIPLECPLYGMQREKALRLLHYQ